MVIIDLLDSDPWRLIVPAQIYHAMKKRGRCCGCFPGVVDIIVRVTEHYHRQLETPEQKVISMIERLRSEHKKAEDIRRQTRARRAAGAAA